MLVGVDGGGAETFPAIAGDEALDIGGVDGLSVLVASRAGSESGGAVILVLGAPGPPDIQIQMYPPARPMVTSKANIESVTTVRRMLPYWGSGQTTSG